MAADPLAMRRAVADKLLELTAVHVAAEFPELRHDGDPAIRATVTLNAIRCLLGRAIGDCENAEAASAMKIELAPMLGSILGQLLKGQPDRILAACLEGHAQIMGCSLGADCAVNVEITAPFPNPTPHLKVVQ